MAREDAFGWICRRHSLTRRSRDGLPAEVDLGFVGLVGGKAGEVRHVELGEQILGADLAQPGRVRLFQLALALGRVVGVEAQDRVTRRDPVIPVDDPDAARVVRFAERNQRRDRGRDPRARVDAREQPLLNEARMNPQLGAQQVAEIDAHWPPILRPAAMPRRCLRARAASLIRRATMGTSSFSRIARPARRRRRAGWLRRPRRPRLRGDDRRRRRPRRPRPAPRPARKWPGRTWSRSSASIT